MLHGEHKAEGALASLRVWLVHDWLTGMRGGERVLLELVRVFPQARIATLFYVPRAVDSELESRIAATSFLQKVPGIGRAYRNLLPLMPAAVRSLRLRGGCDLVISSSHCVAKGVRVPAGTPHLCYCHTPARYLWGMEDQYIGRWGVRRWALAAVAGRLRRFDVESNAGVTAFVANSHNVARRIERCYQRPATVIHPGIDETFYVPAAAGDASPWPRPYYLVVSALVGYKRVDLAVRAFGDGCIRRSVANPPRDRKGSTHALGATPVPVARASRPWTPEGASMAPSGVRSHGRFGHGDFAPAHSPPQPDVPFGQDADLKGRDLVIIGGGPEENRLRKMARGMINVHFLGQQDDEVVRKYYQHCAALVFPGEEDFGLTPLEAQACGKPVIAYAAGGVLETVVPLQVEGVAGATGVLFEEQSAEGVRTGVRTLEEHRTRFDAPAIRRQALGFTAARFRSEMARAVQELLATPAAH